MTADAVVALSIAFGLTLVTLLAVMWLARVALSGPEHPLKKVRYEAGNPPRGPARSALPPQYYGYALVFLVVDAVYALLFLLAFVSRLALPWVVVASILMLPPLLYALRYARRLDEWLERR